MSNWRQYLDEDYEDRHKKVERIPNKPKRNDEDKVKIKREKPRPQSEK